MKTVSGLKREEAAQAAAIAAVLEKIAAMPEPWRGIGERIHALVLRSEPTLQPRLWYGMPAYAIAGKAVCFFRADKKWMTFGFTQEADLSPEAGAGHQLIECAWFLTALDDATEAKLGELVRRVAR